jgi:hypothetical protein
LCCTAMAQQQATLPWLYNNFGTVGHGLVTSVQQPVPLSQVPSVATAPYEPGVRPPFENQPHYIVDTPTWLMTSTTLDLHASTSINTTTQSLSVFFIASHLISTLSKTAPRRYL